MTPALALALLVALALAGLVWAVVAAVRHDRAEAGRYGRPFDSKKGGAS